MNENKNELILNPSDVATVETKSTPKSFDFADEGFNIAVDMTSAKTQFCSMVAVTDKDKANLYNAMNNPTERLSDCINKVIEAKDLYVEVVRCTNQETGEVSYCPRIVIIDKNGVSYQCVSIGIYSALKKIIQIYGVPTWENPVKMEVKQVTSGTRKMLTIKVVA